MGRLTSIFISDYMDSKITGVSRVNVKWTNSNINVSHFSKHCCLTAKLAHGICMTFDPPTFAKRINPCSLGSVVKRQPLGKASQLQTPKVWASKQNESLHKLEQYRNKQAFIVGLCLFYFPCFVHNVECGKNNPGNQRGHEKAKQAWSATEKEKRSQELEKYSKQIHFPKIIQASFILGGLYSPGNVSNTSTRQIKWQGSMRTSHK